MYNNQDKIKFIQGVVKGGTCTGCGLCVGVDSSGNSIMKETLKGPVPEINKSALLPDYIYEACPGYKINYPELYKTHYGKFPENWLSGNIHGFYSGYSLNKDIRRNASSGGIITQVLIYLLETKKIDSAIVVQQGIPSIEKAKVIFARTREDIVKASQSVYIPVSVLDILSFLKVEETYAITCLPDQSAGLRKLQAENHPRALQIRYVLGPYTGTNMYPEFLACYLKMKRVKKNDKIVSLKWRAGEWPGNLEVITESGKILRTPKIYYNFLIPFYITHTSLQQMDFCNEFADLAVGDAWAPEFERQGQGFSVVIARTFELNELLNEMERQGLIYLKEESLETAVVMHGHMLDFKKRGSYIRNKFKSILGLSVPDFGYKPVHIKFSRILVEVVISAIFLVCRTKMARSILALIPEKYLGPVFNWLRLKWKNISKPVKRKALNEYQIIIT